MEAESMEKIKVPEVSAESYLPDWMQEEEERWS